MKRHALLVASAIVAAAFSAPAMAGYITYNGSVNGADSTVTGNTWNPVTDINNNIVGLDWDLDQDRTGNGTVNLQFWGQIDSDPVIHLIQDLDNFTASTWTGYDIKIIPDAFSTVSNIIVVNVSVTGPGSAPSPTILTNEILLTGGSVPSGSTLTVDFKFDINTTDTSGHFFYTIENTPITDTGNPNVPEPASLGVLGLGAAGLLLRRRK